VLAIGVTDRRERLATARKSQAPPLFLVSGEGMVEARTGKWLQVLKM
jgi:hypothetical protein